MQQRVSEALDRLSKLAASRPVSALSDAFSAAGYELALVGGPVRDAFLGRTCVDLDFATNATPDQILTVVTPISDAHWDVGRAFGTIGARVRGEQVEITSYRTDSYNDSSRKPHVVFGETLEGDLVRRDFSVNAMALKLPSLTLVDPAGGLDDLFAAILRTPGPAEQSFGDDPLRMMRAARFSSQLGFTIADDTRDAMTRMAERLEIVSAERIRDEFSKLLMSDNPRSGMNVLVDTGLAERFLPELPALRVEVDEHHRHKDIYEHSLTVLDQAIGYEKSRNVPQAPDLIVRLAALLHDIGKPVTRKYEVNGVVSFHLHDLIGAKMAKKRLRALRFDNDTVAAVCRLIELHLRFFGYAEGVWSDAAVRRYVRDAGQHLERLHILTRSDVTTRNRRKADGLAKAYDDLETRIVFLESQEEIRSVRPELDGDQIMHILGVPPGPEVGDAYRYLLELRLDEGPLGEDEARKRLLAWWESHDHEGVT